MTDVNPYRPSECELATMPREEPPFQYPPYPPPPPSRWLAVLNRGIYWGVLAGILVDVALFAWSPPPMPFGNPVFLCVLFAGGLGGLAAGIVVALTLDYWDVRRGAKSGVSW